MFGWKQKEPKQKMSELGCPECGQALEYYTFHFLPPIYGCKGCDRNYFLGSNGFLIEKAHSIAKRKYPIGKKICMKKIKYNIKIPVEQVYLESCLQSGSAGRTNIKRMAYELLKYRGELDADPQDEGIEFFDDDKFVTTVRLKD